MRTHTCQNKKCCKEFKRKRLTAKFCSNECFNTHKRDNPQDYQGGIFKKGCAPNRSSFKKGHVPWNKKKEPVPKKKVERKKTLVDTKGLSAEEIEILKGCIKGKNKYQEKFFKMFYGKMMGVAMRYTHDQDSAQDVLSDAFIKIFNKISAYKSGGSLEGWVRRIVVNTAIDAIRREKRRKTHPYDADEMSGMKDMQVEDEEFEISDIEEVRGVPVEKLMEAIQSLSPGYRASFNMYVMEGYTHKEISEYLGITEGTSKSNLSKAKEAMRKKVSKLMEDIKNNEREREERALKLYKEADLEEV